MSQDTEKSRKSPRFSLSESARLFASIFASAILIGLYIALYFTVSPSMLALFAPYIAGLAVFTMAATLLSTFKEDPKMGFMAISLLGLLAFVLIPRLTGIVSLVIAGTPIGWIVFAGIAGIALLGALYRSYQDSSASTPSELEMMRTKDAALKKDIAQYWEKYYLEMLAKPQETPDDVQEEEKGDQRTPQLKAEWLAAQTFFKAFPKATKLSRADVLRTKDKLMAEQEKQGIDTSSLAALPNFKCSFSREMKDKNTGQPIIGRIGATVGYGGSTIYKAYFTEKDDKAGHAASYARGVVTAHAIDQKTGKYLQDDKYPRMSNNEYATDRDNKFQTESATYAAVGAKMPHLSEFHTSSRYSNTPKLTRKIKHIKIVRLVEGDTLYDQILSRQNCATETRQIEIMLNITRETQTFHEAGVLHRDIKTLNIKGGHLIDLDGAIKTGTGKDLVCKKSPLVGTFGYLANELNPDPHTVNDKTRTYNEKTEVFALGETFMRLHPLPGDRATPGYHATLSPLEKLIFDMTDHRSTKRPRVSEVIEGLEALQQPQPAANINLHQQPLPAPTLSR